LEQSCNNIANTLLQFPDLKRRVEYAELRAQHAEERAEEAWALVKSYQESNNKVGGNFFEIV
jgi:hypothetical protein